MTDFVVLSLPGSAAGSLVSFAARFDLGLQRGSERSLPPLARLAGIARAVDDLGTSAPADIFSPKGAT